MHHATIVLLNCKVCLQIKRGTTTWTVCLPLRGRTTADSVSRVTRTIRIYTGQTAFEPLQTACPGYVQAVNGAVCALYSCEFQNSSGPAASMNRSCIGPALLCPQPRIIGPAICSAVQRTIKAQHSARPMSL